VNARDAVDLIASASPGLGGRWADLGAGDGTFTRALAELLGPASVIYAVDRDARAVAELQAWASAAKAKVIPVKGDFTRPLALPKLDDAMLDGMLLANALHFVRDAEDALVRLVERLKPGGRVIFVEYDRRAANRWVPFPISLEQLPGLAAAAGLGEPVVTAIRPSNYGGDLYVAVARRPKG
jgi:SAM-dependent methyltransferase